MKGIQGKIRISRGNKNQLNSDVKKASFTLSFAMH